MFKNLARAYTYLDFKEKKLFIFSIFLTFVSAVLESLSIGIIIPLSSMLLGEQNDFIESLEINNWELLVTIVFLLSIFSSLIIRIISLKILNKFSWDLTTKFSEKLLKDIVNKPIEEIEDFDSNDIKSSVVHKIYTLMLGFIVPTVRTFASIIFATIILIFLFYIDPMILIFLSLFVSVPYIIVFVFLKSKTFKLGEKVAKSEVELLKNLNELFFDIRGVRSRSELDIFLLKHVESEFLLRSSQLTSAYLREIPRFYIEVGILSLIGISIYLSTIVASINISIPILAAYVLGLQRALPHFQSIFANLNTINTNQKSVDSVFDKFENMNNAKVKFYKQGKPNILLENVFYEINKEIIFDDFNLNLNSRTFYFLIGSSGSGKSTLVDIISGYKKVHSGNVSISVEDTESALSFMSQKPFIYSKSLKENIVGRLHNFEKERYEKVLKICDLEKLDKELSINNQAIIGDGDRLISGGQIQRISLARTIYVNSSIYILDEPFSSLDQTTARKICQNLIEFLDNAIVICILHNEKILEEFKDIPRIDLATIKK